MPLQMLVIGAQHRQAVERQIVQKFEEAAFELGEVAAVGAQMIVVDVGHDRDHRLQMHERGIAFIGFGHQVAARSETGIAARS
jgi:hypothetical protein